MDARAFHSQDGMLATLALMSALVHLFCLLPAAVAVMDGAGMDERTLEGRDSLVDDGT